MKWGLGIGDWELGIWGLGIGPNPQSPIPNPQLMISIIIILPLHNSKFKIYKKISFANIKIIKILKFNHINM